jgi:hypothetical protein
MYITLKNFYKIAYGKVSKIFLVTYMNIIPDINFVKSLQVFKAVVDILVVLFRVSVAF